MLLPWSRASQVCKMITELSSGDVSECRWLEAMSESVMDGLLECCGGGTEAFLCCVC